MAKRILIADDSVTIQKAFAMTFSGEDVSVTAARSADEGLALAQRARPDLIIADGVMPGRTGYDLCAQVRADPALRGVPFYILASGQQPYDDARGRSAGADGHLLKPWDTAAFMEKVRMAVDGGAVAQGAAPSVSGRTTAASLPASAMEDDDYGEISIDSSGPTTPPPVVTGAPPSMAAAPRATASSMPAVGAPGMRPSLIPGMRPGAMAPARPGTAPVRPLAGPAPAPQSMPPRPAAPPVGRTMIGLPAAGFPMPGAARPAPPLAPPMRSPTAPVAPLGPPPAAPPRPRAMTPTPPPALTPAAPRPRAPTPMPPQALVAAKIDQTIDQKMAAISAKGPEYEAIAKLSREIIEQIVWEVVPELAEAIIREQLEKQRGRG